MKIAILEDNPGLLQMLQVGLRQEGYDLMPHTSVKAFCAFFTDPGCADLIIVDYRLTSERYDGGTYLSGTDVIRKAREIAPDIPAILISAVPLATLIEAASGLTRVKIMQKPFAFDEIIDTIEAFSK